VRRSVGSSVIHKEKRLVFLEMTQGDLADKVFWPKTESYISQIESGKEGLTISVLAKIMKELNSDISFVEF
jgi:transcriptional regulator with XRE-family HTH domain